MAQVGLRVDSPKRGGAKRNAATHHLVADKARGEQNSQLGSN